MENFKDELEKIESLIAEIYEISNFNVLMYPKKLELFKRIKDKQEKILDELEKNNIISKEDINELDDLEDDIQESSDFPIPSIFNKYDKITNKQSSIIYSYIKEKEEK